MDWPRLPRLSAIPAPLILWGLLWAGLNARPEQVIGGDTLFERLHGVRAFLPLVAGYLAILRWLRQGPAVWAPWTAMGALATYAAMGLLISPVVSMNPGISLYWAAAYASVLAVLLSSLSLPTLGGIIQFNWIALSVLVAVAALVALIGSWGASVTWYDITFRVRQPLGMPMVRPTGIARYAAVLALIAATRMLFAKRPRDIFAWLAVLGALAGILLACQSVGALAGAALGGMTALWLRRSRPWLLTFAAVLALVGGLIWMTNPSLVFDVLLRGKTAQNFLSGRTDIWELGGSLVAASPVHGLGFHADRLMLSWPYRSHVSNAWLHAAVQTGLVGLGWFLLGWMLAAGSLRRLLRAEAVVARPYAVELAVVFVFLLVRTLFESTGALFGVDWLLLAPLIAFSQAAVADRPDTEPIQA